MEDMPRLEQRAFAFDLEFDTLVGGDGDFRGNGITCAATCELFFGSGPSRSEITHCYHGGLISTTHESEIVPIVSDAEADVGIDTSVVCGENGNGNGTNTCYAPRMTSAQIRVFVDMLEDASRRGATIVTHGGTSADFRALFYGVEDATYESKVLELARAHVDIVLVCAAEHGYVMSLAALCQGMGYTSKEEDASRKAPELWRSRSLSSQTAVLETNMHDARMTANIFADVEWLGRDLTWITKRKKSKTLTALRGGSGSGSWSSVSTPPATPLPVKCWGLSAASLPFTHGPLPPSFTATGNSNSLPCALECARMPFPQVPFVPEPCLTHVSMASWLLM